jgi:hypothetical protein
MKNEFDAVRDLYKRSNQTIDVNEIDNKIKENESSVTKIDETLAKRELVVEESKRNEVVKRIKEIQSQVQQTSKNLADTLNKISKLEADIIDGQNFISELQNQNEALNESLSTRQVMGELLVDYCPSCLSKLDQVDDTDVCHLCKKKLTNTDNRSRILRIQHELQTQIKESEYLLEVKRQRLEEAYENVGVTTSRLNLESRKLNKYIETANASVDRKYDELLIKKGELNNEIVNLLNQKQIINTFLGLKASVDRLEREVKDLDEIVRNKEEAQRKKMSVALESIQYYSLILLKGDGNYEAGFANASRIGIDFAKNLYYVDERNNFSASSLVILKNSIRFGIFFASIDLDFMRYPRFILCDNVEDKGMTEPRSHNFQKNLVNLASKIDKDFQIILTTSMIDSSLEVPAYTVGEHYYPDKKSLKV